MQAWPLTHLRTPSVPPDLWNILNQFRQDGLCTRAQAELAGTYILYERQLTVSFQRALAPYCLCEGSWSLRVRASVRCTYSTVWTYTRILWTTLPWINSSACLFLGWLANSSRVAVLCDFYLKRCRIERDNPKPPSKTQQRPRSI